MKKALFFILPLITFLSCTKDDDDNPPSKTPEQYLTGHVWKMEEILQVENNVRTYYKRGTATTNFDNDKLTFNANGTGSYTQNSGQTLPATWQFTNTEKTKMNLVITFGPTVFTFKLTEIELSDTEFFYVSEYTNAAPQPVLASIHRTPL